VQQQSVDNQKEIWFGFQEKAAVDVQRLKVKSDEIVKLTQLFVASGMAPGAAYAEAKKAVEEQAACSRVARCRMRRVASDVHGMQERRVRVGITVRL
jgi:hypothetical protein